MFVLYLKTHLNIALIFINRSKEQQKTKNGLCWDVWAWLWFSIIIMIKIVVRTRHKSEMEIGWAIPPNEWHLEEDVPMWTQMAIICSLLLLLRSQLYLWGSPFWAQFLRMWPFFWSNQWGSHIPFSWIENEKHVAPWRQIRAKSETITVLFLPKPVCRHTIVGILQDVATFRLRGWCMLGVFLSPAFSCLGHECHTICPKVNV